MRRSLIAGIVVGVVSAAAWPAAAQTKSAAIPRTADGNPDLSGVWWPGQDVAVQTLTIIGTDGGRTAATSAGPRAGSFGSRYKPEVMAKAKMMSDKDDPTLLCIPSVMGQGLVRQIVQTPKFVVELNETFHGFRIIPTDGRKHDEDAVPSYRGDAVGHWEGDTLVVDVTNFSDRNWILDHADVSFHSTALHEVQRWRRLDAATLEIESTFDDPKVLTGPWTTKRTLTLAPFDKIMETACSGVETAGLLDYAAKENYGRK
jgi:hypothetical protein